MKVLTRGNERVISHWLGAHHRRSRMLRGRWPLSYDCLDEETYGRARAQGVKRAQLGHNNQRKGTLMHPAAHMHHWQRTHSHTCTYTCLYRQFDSVDDAADCIQVTYVKCQFFRSIPLLSLPPLESICCTSPTVCLSACLTLTSCF